MPGIESVLQLENLNWIVSIGTGVVIIGAVLIGFGQLKAQIRQAVTNASKFQRELYQEDGITVYVPRNEYLVERGEISKMLHDIRAELRRDCNTRRGDCQIMLTGRMSDLKREMASLKQDIGTVHKQLSDDNAGIQTIAGKLDLLLRQNGLNQKKGG